jgi:DNA-binding NarL/FixJ family response regulator
MIRIIIGDDHSIFIDGMKALLKGVKEFEVIGSAQNGEDLVSLAVSLKPDLILVDIQMPVKNGIEATKEILRLEPSTRIIALTMMNETPSIKKMIEAGAAAYVLKTTDKDELISTILKVAAGEKYFSDEVTDKLHSDFPGRTLASALPKEILTKREIEILILIAQGLTDREIAEKVFLSPNTIITHRKNILCKLGLKNKVELTRYAIGHDLIG